MRHNFFCNCNCIKYFKVLSPLCKASLHTQQRIQVANSATRSHCSHLGFVVSHHPSLVSTLLLTFHHFLMCQIPFPEAIYNFPPDYEEQLIFSTSKNRFKSVPCSLDLKKKNQTKAIAAIIHIHTLTQTTRNMTKPTRNMTKSHSGLNISPTKFPREHYSTVEYQQVTYIQLLQITM